MTVRRPRRVPERVEQAHIVQLLRALGGQVFVIGTRRRRGDYQGTMQTPGIPDLLVFLPDRAAIGEMRLLFIECKADGGRLRAEQQHFRALAHAARVAHITGTFDAVRRWLVEAQYLRAEDVPHYVAPAARSVSA